MRGDERLLDIDLAEDIMSGRRMSERLREQTYDIVNSVVSMELGFDIIKGDDRAVSTTTAPLALLEHRRREADGVVEGQAEGLVHLLAALATIEEAFLDVLKDGEQRAAGRVRRCVFAIGARNRASSGTCTTTRNVRKRQRSTTRSAYRSRPVGSAQPIAQ